MIFSEFKVHVEHSIKPSRKSHTVSEKTKTKMAKSQSKYVYLVATPTGKRKVINLTSFAGLNGLTASMLAKTSPWSTCANTSHKGYQVISRKLI